MISKKVVVIGAGFSGLVSACFLAKDGFEVTILEKNSSIGGRARKFEHEGFVFDMGPSWYWMPEVFEGFYNKFGKTTADFYDLTRLDPSYRIFWQDKTHWDIPAQKKELIDLIESVEPGGGEKLVKFLEESEFKYKAGMGKFVQKPGKSWLEYLDMDVFSASLKMDLLKSMSSYVRKFFKDPKIISLLEFPVLFLGATANDIPALYSLMNYADMELGTWYPKGGMFRIVEAMEKIALSLNVKIVTNAPVDKIEVEGNKVKGVTAGSHFYPADAVVASADYHHVESQLLERQYRNYDESYWNSRKMAPSSLLYYLGVNKKLNNLLHHNLFFDADFNLHSKEIYQKPGWPTDPLFYVSITSKTDNTVAPEGFENVFILIPTAPGLLNTPEVQEQYLEVVLKRIEKHTGEDLRKHIVYQRNYAATDFIKDYHALKGNAYGLANTLLQTGPLKPAIQNKNLKNLIYTGQLTVPGPGVPPAIISGELAYKEVKNLLI